jgi:hypothetical protein
VLLLYPFSGKYIAVIQGSEHISSCNFSVEAQTTLMRCNCAYIHNINLLRFVTEPKPMHQWQFVLFFNQSLSKNTPITHVGTHLLISSNLFESCVATAHAT